ncbi:Fe-S cluster assembly protein SufD [Myxococcota bacterium]|nr:Fe-S cluster assembly protein SufD [Myxococcota bacterium]
MSTAIASLLRLRERFAKDGPGWLVKRREDALAAFREAGLPTRRLEAWKSTNLAPLAALDFARIAPNGATTLDARSTASLPSGIRVRSLAEVLRSEPDRLAGRLGRLADPKRSALVALQTACLEDGVVVELEAGLRITEPIRIRFLSSPDVYDRPSAAFPRLLVLAGAGCEATIYEEFASATASPREAPGFTNHVAELLLEAGARVELVQLQAEPTPRIHFTSVHAELERDARFASHVVSLAGGLLRSELDVRLLAPGAETVMNGFFLGRGTGHVDHFTTVDHAAPHCTSAQEYRGVLADQAQGVFRGRVIVRPGAQKTDARQSNPNLLLSDKASIDTRPQLEIYADDVRASHGSTIGQLDADALFFLRARGIDEAAARVLLTGAFARTIVEAIIDPGLRSEIGERVEHALAELEAGAKGALR